MKFFIRTLSVVLFTIVSFTAKAQITAGFTADNIAGCAPMVVNFTNTSTGPITGYYWDFGTGTTSVLANPSTSFTTPGTYIVSLTVYGPGGPITTTITITVYPPPTVSFVASDTTVCPGTPITFTSTTIGGVAGPITYTWAFGDGSISTLTSPVHVYTAPGDYTITLTATNSMGCVASLTVPKYIHVFTPPVPDFSATPISLCKVPGTTTFKDLTTGTPGFTYSWDFGDGGSSSASNPTYTYTATGTYSVKLTVTDGDGCSTTIIKPAYITVGNISASFTYPATACVNSIVTLPNTSSPHTSSTWDYGDGHKSIGDPGSHIYTLPGTYTIQLIVSNGACSDTITHKITIIPGPTVSFTQSPLEPCPPPVGITFTATTPPGALISWAFGDGGFGTGSPVTHTYAGRSVDTIIMTVTDPSSGCVSTAKRIDTLFDMAHWIVDTPQSGCVPLTVRFADSAITYMPDPWNPLGHKYPYPMATYSWTFGDGASSTGAYPSHTYTAVGTYRIRVTVVTSNGCTFTDTSQVNVGAPPVVTFSATPTHVCYNKPVKYVVTVISGPVDHLFWEFGDSPIDILYDTSNLVISHTNIIPGIFTVSLTPSYNGCPGPTVILPGIIIDSPKAIGTSKVLCSPRNRVQFTDASIGDDSRMWIFGDGTTSTAANPLHDYPSSTTYVIQLATFNIRSGCRDTTSISVNLTYPTPDFTATRTSICKNAVDTFTATMTGGIAYSYQWDGGGLFPWIPTAGFRTGSLGPVITDTFHIAGIYSIRLVVSDQNGCLDTVIKSNYIHVGDPNVSFNATPATGCWPLTVAFTDASTDPGGFTFTKYEWAFGDGTTSTVTTTGVSHTFTGAGTYTTQEIVIDNIGCIDSASLPLVTVWRPHANFSAYQFPCLTDSTQFIDASTGGVVSWLWMFGDGTKSTATSPWHTYSATGSYTITLAVVDGHGCKDTAIFTSYILVTQVIASFTMSDSFAICPPLLVNFTNTSTGATSYSWNFGDGTTSVVTSPSDLYIATGYDTVVLVAKNAYGCIGVDTQHVNIYGYAGALTYSPLTGCSPLTVHFKAKISNVPSIIWDFSDGSTSKASYTDTTDHTYVLPGSYVPKLILSDNTGCQNSSLGIDTIKVDKVYPGFTTVPAPVCINTPVNFKDTSRSYFSTITTWAWTFTNGDVSSVSAPPYTYSLAGTYPVNLVVTDGWGCTDSVKEDVVVYPPPTITASPDTTICLTDFANIYGYGGVSYTWAPGGSLSCTACNPAKASPAAATLYTVTGTDIHGCANTDTVSVFIKTKTVAYASGDTQICRNEIVQLHDSGATTYVWSPGTNLSNPTIANPYADPSVTTKYTVLAKLASCIPDTGFVWITVHQLPTVDAGSDQRLVEGSTAQLQATGTLIETYSWGEVSTLSCDSCPNPLATMSVTTTYTVHVASDFGCKAYDTVTIHIYCDKSQLFIPNTFTPNGDGQNDIFYPRGIGVNDIKSFRIYNRWGQLLFERNDIKINDASNAWDGSYQGATPRPDVYVYVIDAICETGEPINIKGDVTIIR